MSVSDIALFSLELESAIGCVGEEGWGWRHWENFFSARPAERSRDRPDRIIPTPELLPDLDLCP